MRFHARAARFLAPLAALLFVTVPAVQAREANSHAATPVSGAAAALPAPTTLKPEDPWLYRGGDIPADPDWHFGELPNGLRYAVRTNRVPGQQVSIRIGIDAGSLNETDEERGYAHLIEHLAFRESKYLANGQAIPTWQRLGARLGADTNATTSPTQTVYQLDLPNADTAKLDETIKLLSGMIREPALSSDNVRVELPIVLAEKRERAGPGMRFAEATSELFYAGQPLARRAPGGNDEVLLATTDKKLRAFHDRWYRPENTVIAIVGDGNYEDFAALIERWFADWSPPGKPVPGPDLGKPTAPAGADPANPVGEVRVMVEPTLPRGVLLGIMRPWEKPVDNLEYNRLLTLDRVAQAIVNRRLEQRARAGGSFVLANVDRQEVSRSANATFVNITPLGADWKPALREVREVIADAVAHPPSQEDIDRELAEMEIGIVNYHEQRVNQPGAGLADDLMSAVDIREAVASPATFLEVFQGMRDRFTPEAVLDHTRGLFKGVVTRGFLLVNDASEGSEAELKRAMLEPVDPAKAARVAASDISFATLPPVGTPAEPVEKKALGIREIQQLDYANGVHALIWRTENEPGRVSVKVRFGSGFRAFAPEDAPYISLGESALVALGQGSLGADELDAVSTGRKLGFQFAIDDGAFRFDADTRKEDLSDQLYLFASKLAMPRWDERPLERAKALAIIGYDSLDAEPMGVLTRDLDYLIDNRDARFATPTPDQVRQTTAEGFRKVWEPLLAQGPVEVMVFGDIDPAATEEALNRTFGALPQRKPIPAEALTRGVEFAPPSENPVVLHHRGDTNQAAAVVAWDTGGGAKGIPLSRELELLSEIFSNRLLDELREREGASYTPYVTSNWPADVETGGRVLAIGQMTPEMVPQFFEVTDKIAQDLTTEGPTQDEIDRVTEPYLQLLNRIVSGHRFWMGLVEGSTTEPERLDAISTLLGDYTRTTPERMRELATIYLPANQSFRVAVIPQGQELARRSPGGAAGTGATMTEAGAGSR